MSAGADADGGLKAGLGAWFTARWDESYGASAEPAEVVELQKLSKGQSSDLLDLTVRRGERTESYILRAEPRARQIFLKPDVLREAAVLQGLEANSRAPVPHVYWTEADERLLGAPFFVMGKLEGRAALGKPSLHVEGLLTELTTAQRERLWASAMDGLVAVHATDWRKSHAFLAPQDMSRGYLGDYVNMLCVWYEWTTKGRPFPITDAALAYLRRELPAIDDSDPVLVWNDARVGNMLFRPDGELAAVIDWEVPLIGPAGMDIGYWMMMDEFQSEAIDVARLPGWPDAAGTLARYEALSGRKIDNIDYFIVLGAFFIATTLIRQADMAVEKGVVAAGTRMGFDNTTTQMIARRLGLAVPPMCPDFAMHRRLPGARPMPVQT